ncbi:MULTISPECIES: hypothetical protein [unclassified Mesorhizobium]|uniref:hypothetical protein n=1 Tax=unclassified Mesorhizobium TaxID=325217 RepID=UPI0033372BD8
MARWNARVCLGFPEFTGRITCFGYDWLGTALAVDSQSLEQGELGVVMFEPGTGEALQVPANIRTFHEVDVIEDEDAALAANLYADWREAGGAEPAYNQCIGYKDTIVSRWQGRNQKPGAVGPGSLLAHNGPTYREGERPAAGNTCQYPRPSLKQGFR